MEDKPEKAVLDNGEKAATEDVKMEKGTTEKEPVEDLENGEKAVKKVQKKTKKSVFLSTPMKDKPVLAVPGIGDETAEKMKKDGIITAKNLYGYYLIKLAEEFKEFIQQYGCNARIQREAYEAMKEYDEQYN